MKNKGNRSERRDFGRRATVMHAWAYPKGRFGVPCTIRNVSATGALLEFSYGTPQADSFRLVVPILRQEWWCDVRHRRPKALGVYFDYMDGILAPAGPQKAKGKFRELIHSGRKIHGSPVRA